MVEHLEVEATRRAPAVQLHVILFAVALGHAVVGQVGNPADKVIPLGLNLGQAPLGGVESVAQVRDLIEQWLNILARRLGLADRLGASVALVLQGLGLGLQFAAPGLQRPETVGVEDIASLGQSLGDRIEVAAQQFGIEHGIQSVAVGE